jgi:hypothetical protein
MMNKENDNLNYKENNNNNLKIETLPIQVVEEIIKNLLIKNKYYYKIIKY